VKIAIIKDNHLISHKSQFHRLYNFVQYYPLFIIVGIHYFINNLGRSNKYFTIVISNIPYPFNSTELSDQENVPET